MLSDLVVSIFRFSNHRYRPVPAVDFGYQEKDSAISWRLYAGGSRGYAMRYGPGVAAISPENVEAQNADSHYMMARVEHALLLSGHGLFKSDAVGRMMFRSVQNEIDWSLQYDFPAGMRKDASADFHDWFGALTRHTPLKRAAADAHAALMHTHEAHVFVYRGLEWLVVGEGRSWDDLANDIGVSKSQMRDYKKMINVDHAGRHASRSGTKLRPDATNAARLVSALFDAIHATRSRLDEAFEPWSSDRIAMAVIEGLPPDPFE